MRIYSFSPFGYEGSLVSVEVDLRRGIPAIDIVGLADGAVKESRERMQAAIRNSGLDFPLERVLISLSPADLKKEGAGFDLPIALGVLCAQNENSGNSKLLNFSDDILVLGELELSGKVRPVKGVFSACSTAFTTGICKCIVPIANAEEAREVCGMKVYGADTLEDAFNALSSEESFSQGKIYNSEKTEVENSCEVNGVLFPKVEQSYEFNEIHGQQKLIRALQIAAAGGHNLLAVGAPGCGKTLSLQKFPALLPLLTVEEAQSVTRILSLAGLLQPSQPLVRTPQFRMPHQTASIEGICGGGPNCRPGEISLAHNGVLFLDEAAEFRSSVLQMLRVPLESGKITISRAGRTTIFPAKFQLLMAANPCPCGNFGSKSKICLCSSRSVELYWKKFSAPLLDRIDLRVHVDNENDISKNESSSISTLELRKDIANATVAQRKRQGKKNAHLSASEISEYCKLDSESQKILENATIRYGLSPRAVSACIKIARTIADLNGNDKISTEDLQEAIDFRKTLSSCMDFSDN